MELDMSTNDELKVALLLGEISGKLDTSIKHQATSIKHQATSLRLIIALNILGMTGGTITVGTQALDGWPVIEKLLGLL
jgi:hypothetical protein